MVQAAALAPAPRTLGLERPTWRPEQRTGLRRSGSARWADVGWEAGRSDRTLERLGRPKARHSPVSQRFAPYRVPPLRSPPRPPRNLDRPIGVGCGDFATLWA